MEESVAFSSCGVVTQEIKEKARLAAAMLEEKVVFCFLLELRKSQELPGLCCD